MVCMRCGVMYTRSWNISVVGLLLVILPTAWTENLRYSMDKSDAEQRLVHDKFLSNASFADGLYLVRPFGPVEDKGTLNVSLRYTSIKVASVDENNGYITITLWEDVSWKDPRLAWKPENYSDVQTIKLPPKYVWKPDLNLYTPELGTSYGTENHQEYRTKVVIHSGGIVSYIYKSVLTFHCSMDVRHFPFDTQVCPVSLGSWVHNQNEVNFILTGYSLPDSFDSSHTDWAISSSTIRSQTVRYACCPDDYQTILLTFTLKRNPWFYYYIFVVPAAAIMFILPIIHCFPPASSQKTTLAGLLLVCSLLLHLMIYQQLRGFAEEKPPILVRSYDVQLVMIVISLGISAITASLANVVHSTKRVPRPIRRVTTTVVGKICCFGLSDISGEFTQLGRSYQSTSSARFDPLHDTSPIVTHSGEEEANQNHAEKCLHHLISELRLVRERKQFEGEWYQLALIVDRLTALVFILFFIIMSTSGLEAK